MSNGPCFTSPFYAYTRRLFRVLLLKSTLTLLKEEVSKLFSSVTCVTCGLEVTISRSVVGELDEAISIIKSLPTTGDLKDATVVWCLLLGCFVLTPDLNLIMWSNWLPVSITFFYVGNAWDCWMFFMSRLVSATETGAVEIYEIRLVLEVLLDVLELPLLVSFCWYEAKMFLHVYCLLWTPPYLRA